MREENALSLSRLSKRRGGERGDEKRERERSIIFSTIRCLLFLLQTHSFSAPWCDQRFLRFSRCDISKVFIVFDVTTKSRTSLSTPGIFNNAYNFPASLKELALMWCFECTHIRCVAFQTKVFLTKKKAFSSQNPTASAF